MIVYAVVDDALSPDFPLGVELEVFIRREDAERFIEEVRGDEPEMAAKLRIEERELEAGRKLLREARDLVAMLVSMTWPKSWAIHVSRLRLA